MQNEIDINTQTLEFFCDMLRRIEEYEELDYFFKNISKEEYKTMLKNAQKSVNNNNGL